MSTLKSEMSYLHKLWKKLNHKTNPETYRTKDSHFERSLTVKDLMLLGIGTIVSTTIFTLPGITAAKYSGPAVAIAFLIAAIVAGFIAMNYAEMAAAMPFAGSAFSWINVLFGEFWGWLAGWALLAEYFLGVAFVSTGLSSNFRGLLAPVHLYFPRTLASSAADGGALNVIAIIALIIVAIILSRGASKMTKIENPLVILKVAVIILFIIVGATAIHWGNYVPFIPVHQPHTEFGGWSGIYTSVSMLFLSYSGFDAIAANSAEAKNPKKTMPLSIIGSLVIATILFIAVSLVLVGMFKYPVFLNNSEPVGWALRHSGHTIIGAIVQGVAVIGMFTALIGLTLAGSRLFYAFGRDGMLPRWLGHVNHEHLPNRALWTLTISGIIVGTILPFSFMAELVSAGSLIGFGFVSVGLFSLRKREGTDIPKSGFRVPWYPWLPLISIIFLIVVFFGLDAQAQFYTLLWYIGGILIYFGYGIHHDQTAEK